MTSQAEDSTSVFVTTWMVPSTLLFQLSCSSIKMLNGERMFATGRSRPMIVLLADFSPDDGRVQRCTTDVHLSEWTPGLSALPPWPTTWPSSPSPWMTGSPGRFSTSSSRGPKGSSAGSQASPVRVCVHLYCTLLVLLHYYCQIYQITFRSHSTHT